MNNDFEDFEPTKPNLYEVTFDTKKGGDRHWVIHIESYDAKAARAGAEALWYDFTHLGAHMFHIKVRRLKPTEEFQYHWFKELPQA